MSDWMGPDWVWRWIFNLAYIGIIFVVILAISLVGLIGWGIFKLVS